MLPTLQCNRGFQIMTGTGPKVILPNHFAEELRNHPECFVQRGFRQSTCPPKLSRWTLCLKILEPCKHADLVLGLLRRVSGMLIIV